MRIYKTKNYDEMSRKAANIISAQIILKPESVLGLATGSSPIGTYKQLIEWYNKGDLDFSQIRSMGGIDLQLLGIGNNGHIGFNEPSDSFAKETHCVDLTENTIQANARFFSFIEEVPTQAYTTGIKNIMQARHILLIASGEAKADALYEAVYGPITPHVPASILQLHDEVSVVADEAALSRIIKEGLI